MWGGDEAKENNKQTEENKVKTEQTASFEPTKKESTKQAPTFKVEWRNNSKVTIESLPI